MTDEQKTMLGNDYGFAIFPYHFKEAITNYCSYDYKNEKIDDVADRRMGGADPFCASAAQRAANSRTADTRRGGVVLHDSDTRPAEPDQIRRQPAAVRTDDGVGRSKYRSSANSGRTVHR